MAARTKLDLPHNAFGWAYDDQLDDRVRSQIIKFDLLSGKDSFQERIADAVAARDRPSRPPMVPDERELELGDEINKTAAVVGVFTIHSPDPAYQEDFIQAKGAGIATTFPEGKSALDFDEKALRVVCPCDKSNACFYVLTKQDPDTGLCTGMKIDHKHFFYWPEFRDDTSAKGARKTTWAQKIREITDSKQLSKTNKKKKEDLSTLDIRTDRSFPAQIASAYGHYGVSGSVDYLTQMLSALETMSPELKDRTLISNVNICAVLDYTKSLEQEQYEMAMEEIKKLWPPVARAFEITKTHTGLPSWEILAAASEGLRVEKLTLPYKHARMFFAMVAENFRGVDDIDRDCTAVVFDILEQIKLYVGEDGEPVTQDFTSETQVMCSTIAETLTELKTSIHMKVEKLMDIKGGKQTDGFTMQQAWEQYGRKPDTDSAYLWATAMHDLAVREVISIFSKELDELGNQAAIYQKLAAELRGEQDDGDDI